MSWSGSVCLFVGFGVGEYGPVTVKSATLDSPWRLSGGLVLRCWGGSLSSCGLLILVSRRPRTMNLAWLVRVVRA